MVMYLDEVVRKPCGVITAPLDFKINCGNQLLIHCSVLWRLIWGLWFWATKIPFSEWEGGEFTVGVCTGNFLCATRRKSELCVISDSLGVNIRCTWTWEVSRLFESLYCWIQLLWGESDFMMMITKTKMLQLLIIMMNGDDAMHKEYMQNKYIYYIGVHSIR